MSDTIAVIMAAEGFTPPGPADFDLPPIFGEVTKPMVMVGLSVVLIFTLFYAMSRKAAIVPGQGCGAKLRAARRASTQGSRKGAFFMVLWFRIG